MPALKFTLIQANLHWEDRKANLEMFEEKINTLASGSQVVVLPEMFSTGFSMKPEMLAETMDGPTVSLDEKNCCQKKAYSYRQPDC